MIRVDRLCGNCAERPAVRCKTLDYDEPREQLPCVFHHFPGEPSKRRKTIAEYMGGAAA